MSRSTDDIGELELAGLSEAELMELSEFIDPDVCHHSSTPCTSTYTSTHALTIHKHTCTHNTQAHMHSQYTSAHAPTVFTALVQTLG